MTSEEITAIVRRLTYNEQGLIPTVVQEERTDKVLMVAYMNEESLRRTLTDGETWFFSRSRQELWHKGGTSGHTQQVVSIATDCDADTLLVRVKAAGPACHTGAESCFYDTLLPADGEAEGPHVLADLARRIEATRHTHSETSYTEYLLRTGIDKIGKKIGEESAEVIIAAKNGNKQEIVAESADLLYHLAVLWEDRGVTLQDVMAELSRRSHKQGNKKEVGHLDKTF